MSDKKYKILTEFVSDLSSETKDVETYIFVKDNISKYNLGIDIISKALKDKVIEIKTNFKFEDRMDNPKKSYFEITYTTIIKVDEEIKEKKDLERIILCDVQNEIYPRIEKVFINLLETSGYKGIKFDKKIDFEKLYTQRNN
ncbi:protein-export chaperone SecB [Candidatus Pelagibacter sp.]|nr:protein-export chaperone SecB [Candidatus Pelagibacter sp.]|tara:strand:- start:168 stop:593 length:426 start_codon:yes stop_codon:yes gene_type:complete